MADTEETGVAWGWRERFGDAEYAVNAHEAGTVGLVLRRLPPWTDEHWDVGATFDADFAEALGVALCAAAERARGRDPK